MTEYLQESLTQELPKAIADASAYNMGILHDSIKLPFISSVNALCGTDYSADEMIATATSPKFGVWNSFPPNHPFYRTVYEYIKTYAPHLLRQSIRQGDGVTWSRIVTFMNQRASGVPHRWERRREMPERRYVQEEVRRQLPSAASPEGVQMIDKTKDKLAGLKGVIQQSKNEWLLKRSSWFVRHWKKSMYWKSCVNLSSVVLRAITWRGQKISPQYSHFSQMM